MTPSAFVLAGLLVGLSASLAIAQRPDSLPVGSQLRVALRKSPVGELHGTLEGADSTEMLLATLSRSVYRLRYVDIQSVLMARGREPRPGGAARGAKKGLLIGGSMAIVATAIAYVYDLRAKEESFIPASVGIAVYGLGLTTITTALGAAIGATSRTRWEHAWP